MPIEHHITQPTGTHRATPIVLLHGAWHGAWCYEWWAQDFAAHGYETHTFSLPGHGHSTTKRSINLLGIRDYVAALAEIVDSIQPTPFVIGHSMGGFVLQHYLRRHSLPGAVLLCAIPSDGALPFVMRYLAAHPLRALSSVFTFNLYRTLNTPRLTRQYLVSDEALLSPEQILPYIGRDKWAGLESCFPVRLKTRTPLLVVAAEQDGVFLVREEKQMAAHYRADFRLISGQNHDLMLERDRQAVAGLICEWLERPR